MTVSLSPDLHAQIVAEAAATDGSLRALDRVAGNHGLLLVELRELMNVPQTPAAATSTPAAGSPVRRRLPPTAPDRPDQPQTKRTCTQCDVEQPIDNFYTQPGGRDGRMSNCMTCNNKRPPTESRMVRNRARNRAYAVLAKRHAKEFAELFDTELESARREHATITAAAGGNHDATVARLRPGQKRKGQDVTDRLDVARCPHCQTHHDADHECPSCGDTTPEVAPSVKPWQVRAWALDAGVDCPTRGPIPAAVQAAYDAEHDDQDVAS